jgi:hypothetical protein
MLTPEEVANNCRKASINWMVIVKQHKGNIGNDTSHSRGSSKHPSSSASNTKSPSITPSLPPSHSNAASSSSSASSSTLLDTNTTTVKVKDVLRKTESEVPRSELCMWLASEMAEQARIDHSYTMTSKRNKYDFKSKDSHHHHHHHHHGNDPLHLDMDTNEGQEKKPTNLDVQVVYAEERGKARTKMKQKRKDVLIDKGKKQYLSTKVKHSLFFFFQKLSIVSHRLLKV